MKQTLLNLIGNTRKLLGLTILGVTALAANAQMSGSYTLNSGSAASSSNFQNWQSFWQSLQGLSRADGGPTFSSGTVTGPVTLDVQSSLTTSSQIVFPQISGMSSTNTVTINGNGNSVTFAGPYEVFSFTGGDYFKISKLTIINQHATNAIGIRFSNSSDNNTIDACNIQFSGIVTGTSSGVSAYVAFAASSTAISTVNSTNNGSGNTISNCAMSTTNSNSPGPAFGVTLNGNNSNYSSTATNNTLTGNTIQNFFYMGVTNFYANGNQIIGNTISRKNATSYNCNSTLLGIYSVYNYSTSRPTVVNKNIIENLPYAGSNTSSAPSTVYGMYCWYQYSSSTYRFSVDGNTMRGLNASSSMYITYNYYNQYYDFTNNLMEKCNVPINSGGSAYFYGSLHYGSYNYNINYNTLQNCTGGYYFYGLRNEYPNSTSTQSNVNFNVIQNNSNGYYYTYLLRVYYGQNSATYPINIIGNTVANNSGDYYYIYCLDIEYYGNHNIQRNKIYGNKNASSLGYVYAIYAYYNYDLVINNNLIYDNAGYYGTYGIYSYYGSSNNFKYECKQNTISINGSKSGYSYHYAYPLQLLLYYHTKAEVTGNISYCPNNYGCMFYAYSYTNPNPFDWNHNSYYFPNVSYMYFYTINSGSATSFSQWLSLGLCGKNEYYGDPKFASSTDFRSNIFENQNNVPTSASSPVDQSGATRNLIKSDRGAFESYMDLQAVSTNFTVPASVCAGYQVSGGTTITVKNLYTYDTAYGFNVSYAVNGGPKTSEVVTTKLLPNNQTTVTFTNGLKLNTPGNNRIAIFIDLPDDNRSNDSFIFNTVVKPAPGGAKWNFSATPTKTIYQYGKSNDVTILGEKAIYDMNPPRAYSNTDWGTKWTATAYATTASGASVTGALISKNPSATNSLEYTFQTSNANYEDSMLTLYLKVSDLTNGCDTIVKRNLLIYPSIIPDFKYPAKICEGDAVAFENNSTVKSGNMEFEWDFGTGNPADVTSAPEPVFQFPGLGNYTVTMTARTLPYGFEVSKKQTISVNPIPTVKFTKQNACEGDNLVFTNQTVPSNATYTWDFGDGGAKSTAVNPTKKYAQTGQYTVNLKADLNGCIAEVSQRVYQFDKPVADFALVSGSCDNDNFVFDNKSTIKNGLFGNSWDFNDGTVSTEEEPSHMFTSSGNKNVKLVTTSEFGCKNEKTVVVAVNESPKTDFTNDPACSLTPTTFTNTTPLAGSSVKSYAWNFGDGGTSAAQNPTHNWSTLGPKTVMFTVELVNGCKSSKTEMLNVGVQPNVQFNAADVCAGDPVVFENNTSWSQGEVKYNWEFGDNTTSTNSDPQKVYTTNVTKTYNVTLKASVVGGCEAQLTKAVTVNQGPTTCDFKDAPDYGFGFRGMNFTPINGSGTPGAESGVSYTWVIDGGGTLQGGAPQYDFQEDGTYKVTMRARVTSTGCECTITKNVTMSRTSAEELTTSGFTVFPNPNNGNFNIALTKDFGTMVTVEITSLTGSVISSNVMSNTGLLSVASGNLSDGVYIVRVSNGNQAATRRITISR